MLERLKDFTLDNGVFKIPGVPTDKAYDFIREAVMDNHIPCVKPIGFTLDTPENIGIKTAIGRNECVMENMLAIAENLDFIMFCDGDSGIAVLPETRNVITTDSYFTVNGKPINILGDKHVIATPLGLCGMKIQILRSCGYANMDVTYKRIRNRVFFPLCVVFSLSNYIRILPRTSDDIRIVLQNGFTVAMLRTLFVKWYGDSVEGTLRKGELRWLSKYNL